MVHTHYEWYSRIKSRYDIVHKVSQPQTEEGVDEYAKYVICVSYQSTKCQEAISSSRQSHLSFNPYEIIASTCIHILYNILILSVHMRIVKHVHICTHTCVHVHISDIVHSASSLLTPMKYSQVYTFFNPLCMHIVKRVYTYTYTHVCRYI